MKHVIEVTIFIFVFVVAWIFLHGLLHGLLDRTWTGYEILIGIALMLWLMMRYYRKRRRSHIERAYIASPDPRGGFRRAPQRLDQHTDRSDHYHAALKLDVVISEEQLTEIGSVRKDTVAGDSPKTLYDALCLKDDLQYSGSGRKSDGKLNLFARGLALYKRHPTHVRRVDDVFDHPRKLVHRPERK